MSIGIVEYQITTDGGTAQLTAESFERSVHIRFIDRIYGRVLAEYTITGRQWMQLINIAIEEAKRNQGGH